MKSISIAATLLCAASPCLAYDAPTCNSPEVEEILLRNAMLVHDDIGTKIGSLTGNAAQSFVQWKPHVENVVQTSYDAVNNFRYCEADAVELPVQDDAFKRDLMQYFAGAALEARLGVQSHSKVDFSKICLSHVSYKVGMTLDDPPRVIVWSTCAQ